MTDVAQRLASSNDVSFDTVDIGIVPIIFVPGVMGSRLEMPAGNDWDPDNKLVMIKWALADLRSRQRDLSIDFRPTSNVIRALDSGAQADIAKNAKLQAIAAGLNGFATGVYESRGWGGVIWSFYGTILTVLETTFNSGKAIGNPVYAFGYDFRRSNFDSGDKLVAFIAEVLSKHPGSIQVVVVTHSMGGLVTRAAMVRNPAVISSIRGVVHGAQPANGAVVAYRRFITGATTALDGGKIPDRVLARIMGTNSVEYATLQAGMPGPMQLLPNHLFFRFADPNNPWLKTEPQVDLSDIYAVYALPTIPGLMLSVFADDPVGRVLINGALAGRLAESATLHFALNDTGHPNTHILFSTDLRTDAQVDLTVESGFVKTETGDGTVPGVSGACLNIRSSFVRSRESFNGLEHSQVYQDVQFNAAALKRVSLVLSSKT